MEEKSHNFYRYLTVRISTSKAISSRARFIHDKGAIQQWQPPFASWKIHQARGINATWELFLRRRLNRLYEWKWARTKGHCAVCLMKYYRWTDEKFSYEIMHCVCEWLDTISKTEINTREQFQLLYLFCLSYRKRILERLYSLNSCHSPFLSACAFIHHHAHELFFLTIATQHFLCPLPLLIPSKLSPRARNIPFDSPFL